MTGSACSSAKKKKVMAVASGGGHWIQLLRLRAAFQGSSMVYVTVEPSARIDVGDERFYSIMEGGRNSPFRLVLSIIQLFFIILKVRPDVVVSTGAAPGYFAIRIGKILGAKTVWVDSVANTQKLSLAGTMVGPYADLWLTQWPHLAKENGPVYFGSVI